MADTASLVVRVSSTGTGSTTRELGLLSKASLAVTSALASMSAAGAAAAVVFGVQSVAANRKFEKSLSDLSAITGATGKQLLYLKAQSLDIGASTSLAASQASEAFKLIASAKPDLLESATALDMVTRAAVTLAEAAGTDLPTAADTLGSSLNQFSADASDASRFINVLAAGAKFGSSEINETAIALKNSGVAAKAVGVSFEEANAAIQALAAVGIKGGEAGTGLRNILLKLESDTNSRFRPSINGLAGALSNLSELQEDASALTKRFGLESIVAAQALMGNVGAVADLTLKLTGTNTALEQAKTRTSNLDGDIKILSSSVEALSLAIGNKLNPAARETTQLFSSSAKEWATYIDSLGEAPETIEGVRLRLSDVNQELAETQARQKRFGANSFFDSIFGGAGDKVEQVKSLQVESQKLLDLLNTLQGVNLGGTVTPKIEPTKQDAPTTSAEGQAQLETLRMQAKLYGVVGVERAKLSAVQSLGVAATKQEREEAERLAAQIYNLNDAQQVNAEKERSRISNTQNADAYLEQLRQSNLNEMQLIDTHEQEKKEKVFSYIQQGLISANAYQDALTEIETTAVLSRAEISNRILDEQAKAQDDIRKAQVQKQEAEARAKEKVIDDGIVAQRNMTTDLKAVLGEQNDLYKASAIVSATVNTYRAANAAMASASEVPFVGWLLGPLAAGAAIVAGLANVAAISGAREQGGSMRAGGAYQMAERGKAEVIVPQGASRARTASQMRDIMGQNGGGGVTGVTIVNNTTGRVDNVQTEQRDDGQLMVTIEELVAESMMNPDSRISKARRASSGQPGF